jgi:hypothetical protein
VLDRVTRCDTFSMKKPLRSSARGASFHTKHASNANVVRVVLLGANSYLALWMRVAEDGSRRRAIGEAYVQPWTVVDDDDDERPTTATGGY